MASDSITGMGLRLARLRQEYDGLSKAQRSLPENKKLQNNISGLAKEYDRLKKANGQATQSVGFYEKATSGLTKTLGALGLTTGAVTLAKEAFNRTMRATNDLSDKFDIIIAKAGAGVDSFFRSIASGDWSNLVSNMREAMAAAEEYTRIMDELEDRKLAMGVEESRLKAEEARQKNIMRDRTKSDEERIAAAREVEKIEYRILTMRQKDLKKAMDAEIELANKQTGAGREFLRVMVSQYDQYEEQQKKANQLIELQDKLKDMQRLDPHSIVYPEGSNDPEYASEAVERTKKEIEDFIATNREMIRFSESNITFEQFTDQWRLYGKVVDEQRKRIAEAIIAVNQAETNYHNAIARSQSMASGLMEEMNRETETAREKLKSANEKLAEEQKNLSEKITKSQMDMYRLQTDKSLAALKEITGNEKNQYGVRMEANMEYERMRIEQINHLADYETSRSGLLSEEITMIRKKQEQDVYQIVREASDERIRMAQDETNKIIESIRQEIDYLRQRNSSQENHEIADLSKEYAKGLISREQYEKAKKEITDRYARQSAEAEKSVVLESIDTLESEIEKLDLQGVDTSGILRQIVDFRRHLDEIEIQANEQAGNIVEQAGGTIGDKNKNMFDRIKSEISDFLGFEEEQFNTFANAITGIFEGIGDLINAASKKRMEAYDAEIEKINERRDADIESIENSALSQEEKEEAIARVKAVSNAQEAQYEERKKQEQLRQARWEKAWAINQIGIETAVAIMKVVPNPILIAAVAALGAIQTAVAAAQPIPAYEHGTDYHPGGLALVGEKRSEYIKTKKGIYQTKGASIVDLEKGASVYPDFSSFIKAEAVQMADRYKESNQNAISYKELLDSNKELIKTVQNIRPSSIHISADAKHLWTVVKNRERRVTSISRSLHI